MLPPTTNTRPFFAALVSTKASYSASEWSKPSSALLILTSGRESFSAEVPSRPAIPRTSSLRSQRRVEAELTVLLDEVVERDFPFLGACYGIGTLGRHQGAVVDRTYAEPIGGIRVKVTRAGQEDPLFECAGSSFGAYAGHKEAISKLPAHALTLAYSERCPVQAFRIGRHVYATQFHPELDLDGLATRIEVYKYAGYFKPEEADAVLAAARASGVTEVPNILERFVELFARN